jgi:hypothetical protein
MYEVRVNGVPATWSSATPTGIDTFSFDLSSVTVLNDDASIYFRLTMASTVSADGGGITVSGTSRVDNVTIMGVPIPFLDGDFNHDGFVDAADYVMWWKTNSGDMPAYTAWVQHFGESGGGSGGEQAHVPEPTGCLTLAAALAGCLLGRRRVKLAERTRPR